MDCLEVAPDAPCQPGVDDHPRLSRAPYIEISARAAARTVSRWSGRLLGGIVAGALAGAVLSGWNLITMRRQESRLWS